MQSGRGKFIREIEEVLGEDFDFRGEDFSGYGETLNNLIYVRTGGTEGIFKSGFFRDGQLQVPDHKPVRLLTSGKAIHWQLQWKYCPS